MLSGKLPLILCQSPSGLCNFVGLQESGFFFPPGEMAWLPLSCSHKIKRCLLLGRKAVTNLDSVLKSRDITLLTRVCIVKLWFSSSHVWMWELDHKEGWTPKNWCFQIVVLIRLLRVHWTAKIIKPVDPKWNQPWILIVRTDAEAPILWPPDVKNQLIG